MSKEGVIAGKNSVKQELKIENNKDFQKEIQRLEKLANKLSLIILTAFPLAIVAMIIKFIVK